MRSAAAIDTARGDKATRDWVSEAQASAGLDENDPNERIRWDNAVVVPLTLGGATSLLMDHIGHRADGDGWSAACRASAWCLEQGSADRHSATMSRRGTAPASYTERDRAQHGQLLPRRELGNFAGPPARSPRTGRPGPCRTCS